MSSASQQSKESIEEKKTEEFKENYEPSPALKLDKNLLPLIPQPTDSPYDPLNYPNWLKYAILLQVALIASVGNFNVAVINPAVVPMSAEFGIKPVVGTYQTAAAIGCGAFGPLLFTPFANVYGRRSCYLIGVLIGFITAVASALSHSYAGLIVVRAINGFGPSAAYGLGAGTVVDLFYMHQRGKAMGFFTLLQTSGAHLAPIVGGYTARNLGWRWCFWVGAILNGTLFLTSLFALPETIFNRPENSSVHNDDNSRVGNLSSEMIHAPPLFQWKVFVDRLWFWDRHRPKSRRVKRSDFFFKPLGMLKYPSVLFPVILLGVTYGFASIEPALILATLFTQLYNFDTVQNGLANGITLLLGAALGELCSGPVTDWMIQRARKRAANKRAIPPAELRLQGIWTGAITVPAGLLIYGFTVHFRTGGKYIPPCIGMALACFGIQIITSVCYTYSCGDCYRSRSNDVSQCFNFFRQLFGMTLGFYSLQFGEKIGFELSFTVFAIICVVVFLPIVALMFKGEKWRNQLGDPDS